MMKCSVVTALSSMVAESTELWKKMSSFEWQSQEMGTEWRQEGGHVNGGN